jgi:methionyl-tRNA synthetase
MYVWFDALTNYISALGYHDESELYRHYWLDNPHRVHALGKGVIRFHAIYWPAMLLSAGVPLPEKEFVHGYINISGAKMSKTLGNVVDPEDLVHRYGTEATRYFLLRAVHPTRDADFQDVEQLHEQFRARYTADLANDLGNLLNRAVSMIGRYRGSVIPSPGETTELEASVRAVAEGLPAAIHEAMGAYDPQSALAAIWGLVTRGNRYVEETKPWELARAARGDDKAADLRLSTALFTLAESVRVIGVALEPFLPASADRIREQLGAGGNLPWPERLEWGGTAPGTQVGRPDPLFPRLDAAA